MSARRPVVLVSVLAGLLSLALLPGGAANASPSLSDAQKQLDALGVKMDRVNEQANSVRVQLKRVQAQQSGLNRQLSASQAKMDTAQDAVGKIAASAYRNGTLSITGSVLSSGSPQQYFDQLAALDWLSAQQRQTIKDAKAYQAQFADAKKRVDLQVASEARLNTQLSTQKTQISKDQAKWEKIRQSVCGTKCSSSGDTEVLYNGQASGDAATVVQFALAQQGEPYVFAAAGPNSWDCSGLSMMAWKQVGVSLPHSAHQQYAMIKHVSRANIQPGDLVFYYNDISHVGIYIGNGQIVHAPTEGENVKVSKVDAFPIYGIGRP